MLARMYNLHADCTDIPIHTTLMQLHQGCIKVSWTVRPYSAKRSLFPIPHSSSQAFHSLHLNKDPHSQPRSPPFCLPPRSPTTFQSSLSFSRLLIFFGFLLLPLFFFHTLLPLPPRQRSPPTMQHSSNLNLRLAQCLAQASLTVSCFDL